MNRFVRWMLVLAMVAMVPAQVRAQDSAAARDLRVAKTKADSALIRKALAIQKRVITIDTHNDIEPANFTWTNNYSMRLSTQVNIPKMKEGGLDVSFMIAYVGQGALDPAGYAAANAEALSKFEAVHRLTEVLDPTEIGFARTSADIRRLHAQGKKVAMIGVENGFQLGLDLNNIRKFHDMGASYLSLAHNGNSQYSDSNTGETQGYLYNNGLSDLGKAAVDSLNLVGIMIDESHPSKGSMMQTLKLSKAPIIGSHSGIRAICSASRNMDDEQLDGLKKNGGVIQIVGFATYVKCDPPKAQTAELAALDKEFGLPAGTSRPAAAGGNRGGGAGGGGRGGNAGRVDSATVVVNGIPVRGVAPTGGRGGAPGIVTMNPDSSLTIRRAPAATRAGGAGNGGRGGAGGALAALDSVKRASYTTRLAAVNAKYPPMTRANVHDMVDHIDYAVKRIGIDHVGISSDFDGGGGIDGYNGSEETLNVTIELVKRGYTEEQIRKLWGGNIMRVLDSVQAVSRRLQAAAATKKSAVILKPVMKPVIKPVGPAKPE